MLSFIPDHLVLTTSRLTVITGSFFFSQILGILCMIDEGEADWKVLAISITDPWAKKLHDITDVDRELPGLTDGVREWFRLYKCAEGKPENRFALNEKFMDVGYTFRIVQETHQSWKKLVGRGGPSTAAAAGGGCHYMVR